jgi:UDP-glucose 4-epimerase
MVTWPEKKVLVTGGNGFIGQAVVQELWSRGHRPVVFDREQEACGRHSILGDIRDATSVTEAVAHVDAVIHLAGVLGTSETISNPRPAAETNILGALNVLEACTQYGASLVNIAVGNHFEYSTYSITKTTIERFTTMYARYRGLQVCSVRAYNAYGPGQSAAQPYGSSRVRKIIPSFVARALHGEPIEVYGDGSQVMDMVYITDVASALVTALERDGKAGEVYSAGTCRPTTVEQIAGCVASEVRAQTGREVLIRHLDMRPGETPGAEVLAGKEDVQALGLDPGLFVPLEEGIARTVTAYRRMYGK